MKRIYLLSLFIFSIGCEDNIEKNDTNDLLIVASEGNFGSSNGSLSIFKGKEKIQTIDDVGDVVQSITTYNNKLFVVVNNSHLIKVFTITESGLKLPGIDINTNNSSPRELIVHNNKAYFTNYNSQDVKVLDLETYYIEKSIKVNGLPESIVSDGKHLWVAINMNPDYSSASSVVKIDPENNQVINTYEVGKGPQQLLIENNNLWVSRTFYSEDFTETYFGTSLINMVTDDIKIMNYGTGTVCGGDLMNFDGIVHRTFDGGVAPLNADLNVNKLGKIGSFKKEELYSANAFEDKVYMGITSDYMSPDTVFVHDVTGEVINTFTVGAAPGDFAIWKE